MHKKVPNWYVKPNEPRGFGKIGIRPKDGLTMIGWLIATHE